MTGGPTQIHVRGRRVLSTVTMWVGDRLLQSFIQENISGEIGRFITNLLLIPLDPSQGCWSLSLRSHTGSQKPSRITNGLNPHGPVEHASMGRAALGFEPGPSRCANHYTPTPSELKLT